jgi:NADH:ubiquinone oxidoreductase subunit K
MFFNILPIWLFFVGMIGLFRGKKNIILMIISLEVMLLGISLHYVLIGWGMYGDMKMLVFAIFLLSIGAAESAIGLALAISYYKHSLK